jgi:hypothetical protein
MCDQAGRQSVDELGGNELNKWNGLTGSPGQWKKVIIHPISKFEKAI